MFLPTTTLCVFLLSSTYAAKHYVKGPKSLNDKIAVVGAGVSGIHMAYLLKEKGFRNVEVLEKTSKIGGKSRTVTYRGAAHEMGTCYISPDYAEVLRLVRKFDPTELVPFPSASIWLDGYPTPIPYQKYVAMFGAKMLRTTNPVLVKQKIGMALMKYIKLHYAIFGQYRGELMPRVPKQKMGLIRGTFMDFLKRNRLEILTPIFYTSTTIQGYGQLHRVAALYGLMWNTPTFMQKLMRRMQGLGGEGMYILKNGFQRFWERLAYVGELKVHYNVNIRRMIRSTDKQIGRSFIMMLKSHGNQEPKWAGYDFVVWSPEMKTSLKLWENTTPTEMRLFKAPNPSYFTASMVNYFDEIRGLTPIDYFISKMSRGEKNSVWAQRDTYSVKMGYQGPLYKNKTFPSGPDHHKVKTVVAYQMAEEPPSPSAMALALQKQLRATGGMKITLMRQKTWRYFSRYTPAEIESGVLWDIYDMQGEHGMWYIGSSVCFESVKSVIQYNLKLVREMKPLREDNNAAGVN